MSLGLGLANAGYAVGTVLAVQFAQLLPQRRMMVLYAALLVIGSVLAAAAQNPAMFIAGHVLQGLCTSLLLIAAVPPLAIGFGLPRIRSTAVIMNVCIFGAVALGPTIGGIQASAHALAAAVLDHRRHLAGGAGPVGVDVRGRPARRPGRAAGSVRARPRRGRLRCRVLRRIGATDAPLPRRPDVRAAVCWAGADRRPDRQPVPRASGRC